MNMSVKDHCRRMEKQHGHRPVGGGGWRDRFLWGRQRPLSLAAATPCDLRRRLGRQSHLLERQCLAGTPPAAIGDFRRRYPGIELVLGSGERLVDLVGEGVDCTIRAGTPDDSTLIARRLAAMPQVICASPGYLTQAGKPRHPDELANHQAVKFFSSGGATDDSFDLIVGGEAREFTAGGWISVNDAGSYAACPLRGCGLIQVPRYHVEDALDEGRLVEVLSEWPSPELPVSALYPHRRHLSPRVRVFVDWISEIYAEKFGSSQTGVK